MGDFQGHPFRGNQYSAGGITATYNPDLTSEARNVGLGKYEVGPKFLLLPPDVRAHVLKHEEGHDLSDAMLRDGSAWALVDDPEMLPGGSLNGQTTPGEVIAEAYAVMHSEPKWLGEKFPKLAGLVKRKMAERSWRANPARSV